MSNSTDQSETTNDVYSVPSLLQAIALSEGAKTRKQLGGQISVFGRVTKLKHYDNVQYFVLLSGGSSISCSVPGDIALQDCSNIVIRGGLTYRPSRFSTGLDVLLEGLPVGSDLVEAIPEGPSTEMPIKQSYRSLYDFSRSHKIHEIALIGSETGVRDVNSKLTTSLVGRVVQTSNRGPVEEPTNLTSLLVRPKHDQF